MGGLTPPQKLLAALFQSVTCRTAGFNTIPQETLTDASKFLSSILMIIGGGPAGLAAAVELHKQGIRNMIILEREAMLGGILRQCIHNGFGLHRFKEELTGPEYAQRDIDKAAEMGIDVRTGVTVLSVDPDKTVTAISRKWGLQVFKAKAVVLAMGCRERSRGALNIPGYRPCLLYTSPSPRD